MRPSKLPSNQKIRIKTILHHFRNTHARCTVRERAKLKSIRAERFK
jgi:hypothetical protein